MFYQVFGKPRERVDWSDVTKLVESGAFETDHLDFKAQLPEPLSKEYRQLARHVSGFANSRGGLIVFGVLEKDDQALELNPLCLGERVESTLKAINAFLFPPVPGLRWLELRAAEANLGVAILEIPASHLAPHAVSEENALSYWRRSGRSRHLLSEPEVERAYQARSGLRENAAQALVALESIGCMLH